MSLYSPLYNIYVYVHLYIHIRSTKDLLGTGAFYCLQNGRPGEHDIQILFYLVRVINIQH